MWNKLPASVWFNLTLRYWAVLFSSSKKYIYLIVLVALIITSLNGSHYY